MEDCVELLILVNAELDWVELFVEIELESVELVVGIELD